MSRAKLRLSTGLLALALLLLVLVAATWFARGFYDKVFMLENHLVVVNATDADHSATIAFPSGEQIEVDLKSGFTSQALVDETGEGSIAITIDGTRTETVGYVTSLNGMMILTIDEDRVLFSPVSL